MSVFDNVEGARVKIELTHTTVVLKFPKPVSFEKLLDTLQAMFGESKNIGGPAMPVHERKARP